MYTVVLQPIAKKNFRHMYSRLTLLALLLALRLMAQSDAERGCGYSGKSPWLLWYQANRSLLTGQIESDTSWLYVPVTLHLVGDDAGSGHFPLEQAIQAMCLLNAQFEPTRIRFYLMPTDPVRYYNNSSWNDHDFSDGFDMLSTVVPPLRNRLNIFVVANPAGNCGYAWLDAVVMRTTCSGPDNITWAHEVGHHFSLPHTFSGWEGFEWNYGVAAPEQIDGYWVEKVDRTNCLWAGDGFCDTPPDYLNYRWQCDSTGRSLSAQLDPDGVSFRSDGSLIMSYSFDRCSGRFSPEQIMAMRLSLRFQHESYLQMSQPLSELPDDSQVELVSPLDSTTAVQYNQIELRWKKVPGARYYVVEVSRTPTFSQRFFSETLIDADHIVITKKMPNNWTLFWRVRAYSDWDLCQPYANAQVGSFRTQNLSITNELERRIAIMLKPNPASAGQPAQILAQVDNAADVFILLYDATGRLCWQTMARFYPGENTVDLPVAQLESGVYTLILRNELGAIIRRCVVAD